MTIYSLEVILFLFGTSLLFHAQDWLNSASIYGSTYCGPHPANVPPPTLLLPLTPGLPPLPMQPKRVDTPQATDKASCTLEMQMGGQVRREQNV